MSAEKTEKTFTVGQQLWWVYEDKRDGKNHFVTITDVGRKYLKLENSRKVHIETLRQVVQFGAASQCYVTKEEHDAIIHRQELWSKLKNIFAGYRIPDEMTAEQMEKALQALKN